MRRGAARSPTRGSRREPDRADTAARASAARCSAVWPRVARAALDARRSAARRRAMPVRDWISVDRGPPARVLGFDQALRLGRRRAARARPGDGLFGLGRAARQPEVRALHADLLPGRATSLFMAIAVRRRAGRGPGAGRDLGEARALALRRRAAAAGGRAGPAHRQGRQRRAPLDPARLHELPAVASWPSSRSRMYAAGYMVRKMDVKENFVRAVLPMAVAVARRRRAAAGRARHGRLHGDRGDRDGHPVPRRRQRPHVLADRRGAGRRLRADDRASAPWRRERIFAYLEPVGREVHARQGLPAVAFADRLRPRRDLRRRASAAASRSCTTCPRRTPTSCSP